MAITTNHITVAATATKIATISSGGATVYITNAGAVTVYIGGSAVTTSIGIQLLAGQSISGTFAPGEDIYGIVTTETCVVHYFMNEAL